MTNTQKFKRQSQHKGYGGSRSEPKEVKVAKIAMTGTVIASILALAGVLIGALFAFPPVIAYFEHTPTVTPTVITVPSDTPTILIIPSETSTEIPKASATVLPTETFTPSPEPTFTSVPTATPVPPKMMVATWANKYAGAVPLVVKFTAENSYVEFADGTRSYCSLSTCTFTWSVVNVAFNTYLATPQPWRESFTFTFPKRGLYYVKVTVCQSDICAVGQIQVEGR